MTDDEVKAMLESFEAKPDVGLEEKCRRLVAAWRVWANAEEWNCPEWRPVAEALWAIAVEIGELPPEEE